MRPLPRGNGPARPSLPPPFWPARWDCGPRRRHPIPSAKAGTRTPASPWRSRARSAPRAASRRSGAAGGPLAACALLGVALGLACGGFAGASLHARDGAGGRGRVGALALRGAGRRHGGAFGPQCYARATAADGPLQWCASPCPKMPKPPLYGDVFAAHARLERPSGSTASHCWQHGASATALVEGVEPLEPGGPGGARFWSCARAPWGRSPGPAAMRAPSCRRSCAGLAAPLATRACTRTSRPRGLRTWWRCRVRTSPSWAPSPLVLLRALRVPRAAQGGVEGAFLVAYLVFAGAPVSAARAAAMAVRASRRSSPAAARRR